MQLKRAAVCLLVSVGLHCGGATAVPSKSAPDPDLARPESPPASPPDQAPRSPEVMKGVSSLEANDVAGAKAHFQAALQANPADADALYYLGQFSEQAGDVGGAETLYKRAVQARPGFALAEENLSALYDDAQRYDDALAVITPGLAAHPKDGTLHLNAGIAYGGKKDEASAVREFDVAIGIAPSDASFRFVYGHWLGAFGRQDAALAQLQAAVARAGKNVGVLAGVAHELHVLKALPECVAVFTQAIALKDAAELWTERAACKIGQKDDAGALADLRAATTKDAAYAPAHLYLGNELAKAGDYTAAIAEYQAFLKLEPNGPYAKTVAEKIRVARQHGGH